MNKRLSNFNHTGKDGIPKRSQFSLRTEKKKGKVQLELVG